MADATRLDTPGPDRNRRAAPRTRLDADRDRRENTAAAPANGWIREPLPPGLAARFRQREELGFGTEASVSRCTDGGGRDVAIKLYRHAPRYVIDFDSAEYRAHFRPEHTVQVEERGVDHGVHYEVMEYCAGGTLENLLDGNPGIGFEERALAVLAQLADAIGAVQGGGAKRLVHGDIKPKNILLRSRTPVELVLADFGLTVDLGDRSRLTSFGDGTIAYNAPELVRFRSPAADWWSLGMVMYQFLVRRQYFQRDDGQWMDDKTIERYLTDNDVSLADLDRAPLRDGKRRDRWRTLLAGLLTRNTEQRWGHAQVTAWRRGDSPRVHRPLHGDAGTPAPAAEPRPAAQAKPERARAAYALAGVGEYHDPAALGAAMAADPATAARRLAGRGREKLVSWLINDAATGDRYAELNSHGSDWGPDESVAYFVARLAPDAPVTYQRRPIATAAELRRLADDRSASAIVADLYRHDLLSCLATGPRTAYRMIDANWHDIVEQALETGRARHIPLEEPTRVNIVAQSLLLAASDTVVVDEVVRRIRARLNAPELAEARATPWFAGLLRDARL